MLKNTLQTQIKWLRVQLNLALGAVFLPLGTVLANNNNNDDGWLSGFGVWGEIVKWGIAIFLFLIFIFIAFFAAKIVAGRIMKRRKYEMHKEVILLIERAVFFTIIILGGVIAFSIVGIDLTWVMGPLSLGLGFAFRDLLANIIGGMVILTQKKFKIDDIININGKLGRITNMEMRVTEVQAFDGTSLIIPNADMLTEVVQNLTANSFRRISVQVGVHYSTPLPYAIETALAAVKKHPQVVPEPHPEALTLEFGDSAILIEVRFWIESTVRWWSIQSEVIQYIKQGFDDAGITIPFPIRTLSLDPYDRNLLEAANVKPDFNPAYAGYSAEDLKPENLAYAANPPKSEAQTVETKKAQPKIEKK